MIPGRWAICTLERPGGPAVKMLTDFMWWSEATERLKEYRTWDGPLGLATCASCHGSDDGCGSCNPKQESLTILAATG